MAIPGARPAPSLSLARSRSPPSPAHSTPRRRSRCSPSGPAARTRRWEGISASVLPSVLWSLYSFLRSPDDYWETVCTTIAVGGDTDTMAAMAGAISGAHLGPSQLPRGLVSRLNDRGEWNAEALTRLARDCGG